MLYVWSFIRVQDKRIPNHFPKHSLINSLDTLRNE